MELHTVGVNGGYTQADVTALAAILTGMGSEAALRCRSVLLRSQAARARPEGVVRVRDRRGREGDEARTGDEAARRDVRARRRGSHRRQHEAGSRGTEHPRRKPADREVHQHAACAVFRGG